MATDGSQALSPHDDFETQIASLEAAFDSPVFARLLAEVRGEESEVSRSYNRTYNRHNR